MKISVKFSGQQDLDRRLKAMARFPRLQKALDDAAQTGLETAQTILVEAGETDLANSLTIERIGNQARQVITRHPRGWFAEHGTRRQPALRWLQLSARAGAKQLRQGIKNVIGTAGRSPGGLGGS